MTKCRTCHDSASVCRNILKAIAMENFWTDTPFGIALLASLFLTTIVATILTVTIALRSRVNSHSVGRDSSVSLILYLIGYALLMTIVTYLTILLYWIATGLIRSILPYQSLSIIIQQVVLILVRVVPLGLWLGTAILLFRRMFHQWL